MNHQPLLPLYENETLEEKDARRRERELLAAQSNPTDNIFTALSKWFARNSVAVKRVSLLFVMLLGITGLYQSSVISLDAPNVFIQMDQRQHAENPMFNMLRDAELAMRTPQFIGDDEGFNPYEEVPEPFDQLVQDEHSEGVGADLTHDTESAQPRRRLAVVDKMGNPIGKGDYLLNSSTEVVGKVEKVYDETGTADVLFYKKARPYGSHQQAKPVHAHALKEWERVIVEDITNTKINVGDKIYTEKPSFSRERQGEDGTVVGLTGRAGQPGVVAVVVEFDEERGGWKTMQFPKESLLLSTTKESYREQERARKKEEAEGQKMWYT